ncbi:MAG: hypothetical protein WCD79_17610 [Chthoniobacteraceae bacterium]
MSDTKHLVFHLLPNAHLDPVWLWDWREGLNEGIKTVRTVLELMDEFSDLTFIRGESAIYEHVQKYDPASFKKIKARTEEGRWDVVGGTVIQPDTNLASTEVLCREFERGLNYFKKNLGVRPVVAWQADSFGHSAGLPNILSAFGMESFAFTRPQQKQMPLSMPAFWWKGDWGNKILSYRQYWSCYCSERDNMPATLDGTLKEAENQDFVHVGVLFGLGNHGGGPTRRHLHDIKQWQNDHPNVEVRFSTLHGFFAELKKEISSKPEDAVPSITGELGFCLRGCYSSVQRFKSLYRNGESRVAEAEITKSVIGTSTGMVGPDLLEAWDALLFNAFHDILPGSSIERAFEEQTAWMGLAIHRASEAKFAALNQLASLVDTSVPAARRPDVATDVPVLLWNPLPRPFTGLVEVEAALDYRPIWDFKGRDHELPVVVYDYTGKKMQCQVIKTENTFLPQLPWRKRVIVPVEIPAFGWTTLRLGWRDQPEEFDFQSGGFATSNGNHKISNNEWDVEATDGTVKIQRHGKNFFALDRNLEIRVVEDHWGSWGGMNEEKDSYCLNNVREVWKLTESEILETGPLRAKLWTRWSGKNSWLDLSFFLSAGSSILNAEGRLLWNERSARLNLVMPCEGDLEYDVPGGKTPRDVEGNVPGGRWAVRTGRGEKLGFASDVLGDFRAVPDELIVALARATRYATDVISSPNEKLWQPTVDCGELKFQFSFFGSEIDADHVVDTLLSTPTSIQPAAASGPLPGSGSLGSISPQSMKLLSVESIGPDHLKIRLQNRSDGETPSSLRLGNEHIELGSFGPGQIRTFAMQKNDKNQWQLDNHAIGI